ncbi:MAG: hypothetical protein ACXVPU_07700 [Bacteroidia bacterium]
MKRISKTFLKGLLIIVLFTSTSIVLNTSGVKTTNEANASVSQYQVYKYLVSLGYKVYDLTSIQGSEDWQGHTSLNGVLYITTVHVQGGQIIDHEDIPC